MVKLAVKIERQRQTDRQADRQAGRQSRGRWAAVALIKPWVKLVVNLVVN